MIKSLRYLLFGIIILVAANAKAQTPTSGDCLGAIAICNTSYSFSSSPSGDGNYNSEINPSSCLASGELNSAWFIFTVQSSGQLSFVITPNVTSDDYDWAVYNLTNANCNNIYSNASLQVSCNYSDVFGNTGPNGGSTSNSQGATGSPFNATIPVTAGQTFVINVSNFSSTTSGYTINFGASTASIFDNVAPSIQSVTTPACGSNSLTFNFNENILCSSISASDFTLTGPGGPYTINSISGSACSSGGTNENTYTLNVSPAITSSGSYSLNLVGSVTDNCGNAAPSNTLNFSINAVASPTATVGTDPICANNSTILTASGSTGNYQWYDAASGGTLLSSASTYTTPSLTTTTTYYVQAMSGICTSARVPVTVTVNPSPANPTVSGTSVCENNSVTLNATAPGPTYGWYDAASGGTLLSSASSYTTPALTSSVTYYVQTTVAGCTSGRTPVTVTVNPVPGAPTVSGTTICEDNSTTLTPTGPGGTYEWFNASSGGTLLFTGGSFNTGNLTATTTYYVQTTSGGCTSSRTPVTVTVTPKPAAPTASGTTICGNNTATLNATAPGGTYTWYDAASGGTLVNTGASFTTGTLTSSVTYYVESTISGCTGPRTAVTVTVNPKDDATFSYTGSSFCQSGGNQSPVISGTPGGNFSSTPAGLSLNAVSGQITAGTSTTGNYTVTYTTSGICPDTKTQSITITNAPVANFSYSGPYCTNGTDPLPTFSGGGSAGTFSSAVGIVFLNTSTGEIDLSASTPGSYMVSNDILIAGCSPASWSANIVINPAPAANAGSTLPICDGQSTTIGSAAVGSNTYSWTSNPAGFTSTSANPSVSPSVTTIYSLTETIPASGCSATNSVTVTVNPTPAAPTVAPQTICSDNSVTLTATAPGGTYEWYDASSGGTLLQTGASYTTPVLTTSATYYVQASNATCTGSRSAVTVTVNPKPVANAGSDDAICSGDSVQLQATGGTTYAWSPAIGLSASNIDNPKASPSSTTTYAVTATSAAGCSANDTVVVQVKPAPTAVVNGLLNICSGTSTILSAAASTAGSGTITGYQWLNNNSPIAGATNYELSVSAGGNYSVIVSNSDGCIDTSAVTTLNVYASPTAIISGNTSFCFGDSVILSGLTSANGSGTITGYQWFFEGSYLASTTTVEANTAGNYTLVVTDDNFCTDTTLQYTVGVNPLPDASFTGLSTTYCITATSTTMVPVVAGGVFSGTAVTGNTFDPGIAGVGGPYNIQYTVTDGNGCTNSYVIPVTVNALPDAGFAGLISSYCVNETTINLVPNTPGGVFTGAGVNGLQFDPAAAGVGGPYWITYTLSQGGCIDSTRMQVTINPLPDATFSGLSSAYCISSPAVVMTPVTSGGLFTGTGVNLNTFDPSAAGIGGPFTIQYTVTDGNGCSQSSTQQVTVNDIPDANFSGVASAYCVNDAAITLVPNVSGGTFTGPGVTGTTFDPASAGAGSHQIQYSITDANSCTNTSQVNVTINGLPDAGFNILASSYCVDATVVTLTPNTAGGSFTGTGVAGTTFDPAAAGVGGPYTVQYTVTDANGCQNQSTQQVNVNALPDATFTGLAISYCESSPSVTLTPTISGGVFTGAGVTGSSFDPVTAGTGPFTVSYQVTDANGCSNSSSQSGTINALPLIDRTALLVDSSDCGLNTGQISGINVTGSSPFIYYWMNDQNDTISTGSSSLITGLADGAYHMSVVDINGCISNCGPDNVYMRPGVTAAFACSVDSGAAPLWVTFANQSQGATIYSWTFGEVGTSTEINPGKLFKEEGVYAIEMIATNSNGCVDTALLNIIVTEEVRIIFPNVFTPNNDGTNDLFHFNTSGLSEFSCFIYNRWGESVYEWSTVNSGWDGRTLAGLDAPAGVYYFVVKAISRDGEKFQKEGTVTLVR